MCSVHAPAAQRLPPAPGFVRTGPQGPRVTCARAAGGRAGSLVDAKTGQCVAVSAGTIPAHPSRSPSPPPDLTTKTTMRLPVFPFRKLRDQAGVILLRAALLLALAFAIANPGGA